MPDQHYAFRYAKLLWETYGSAAPETARPYPNDTYYVCLRKAALILSHAV